MLRIYSVLLVEDDANTAEIIKRYLDRYNFTTHHVTDGRKALHAATEHAFDLVILDLMMPVVDGFTFLDELHSVRGSRLPVIIASARTDAEAVIKVKSLGAAAFVAKPLQENLLLDKIKTVLALAPTDIIKKQDHPFTQRVWQTNEGTLRVEFTGVPGPDAIGNVVAAVAAARRMTQGTREMLLDVPIFFALAREPFPTLLRMLTETQKQMKFARLNTRVTGDFLQRLDPMQTAELRKIAKLGLVD